MKLLDLVPTWLWAAAVSVLSAALLLSHIQTLRAEAHLMSFKAKVAERTAGAQAEARSKEAELLSAAERIADEAAKKQRALVERAAVAERVAGGLRDEIARLNARAAPEDSVAAAFAGEARTARELLGACAARYVEVARDADELKDQVTGLQSFAQQACHAGR